MFVIFLLKASQVDVSQVYVVQLVLIIDSREQYSNKEKSRADSLERHIQLVRDRNIAVEVRGLQQGDVLWIAKPRCACCPIPLPRLRHNLPYTQLRHSCTAAAH